MKPFNFGEAIERLKRGEQVCRSGWNGKGMYLFYVNYMEGSWLPFIAMKTVDGKLVPWLASQTDILAEDWLEV